ncbi:MAG: SulP family inorganic anion transporter [Prochlorothrix sp.]|nr:SulP family inorganic anion transporter [Prochlorothrix sp.]
MTTTPHPPPASYSVAPSSRQLFQPREVIASFTAGLITAIIGVIRAISYAALIFAGPLAIHLDLGIGMAILSSAVISIVVALTSSLPGMIATPLAAPTAVLSILAAGVADDLVGQVPPQTVAVTVIAAIALGSLCTGAFLWILGRFKLGRAVQFIPYPVIGGFMAGTGWLLIRGAFEVITDRSLQFATVLQVCQGEVLMQWLTGLAIGAALLGISKQFKHYLAMPLSLLAAIGLFYSVLLSQGTSVTDARSAGWLLGTFDTSNLWHPLSLTDLGQVQWGSVLAHGDSIGLLMFVSLLSLVLTNNGIELSVGKTLDLDRELQSIGLANFMAGLGSSMAGNQALPSTLLVYKMGATHRLVGVFKALSCIAVLLSGPVFLPFLPKPILGSLLVYLGLNLLFQWLYEARSQFSTLDYLTLWATMIVINRFGFLEGILAGFVLALLTFLYRYSCLAVVQDSAQTLAFAGVPPSAAPESIDPSATGTESQTNSIATATTPLDPTHLGVLPIHLQGFLFFGNANGLLREVRNRTQTTGEPGGAGVSSQPMSGNATGNVTHTKADSTTNTAIETRGDRALDTPTVLATETESMDAAEATALAETPYRYLMLDFQQVHGLDASAVLSFQRITQLAYHHNLEVLYTHVSPTMQAQLTQGQAIQDDHRCHLFPSVEAGLAWCQAQRF